MKNVTAVIVLVCVLAAAGCAKLVGPYYLEHEQYEEGIATLGERFQENPDDATSAYYLGRYYLALNQPKEGLTYLNKAVVLDPENADYVFWTGVAHWALLDFKGERAAYEAAIRLDPKHISAHLYLGHGDMDRGAWAEALTEYDKVIKLDAYNPEALYNRAQALKNLGRTNEEIAAWKKFLEYYPDGSMAMTATEQLNLQGDFTYRNHIIGKRNITLRSMAFKPGTDVLIADSKASLQVLSAMLRVNKALTVHIVSFAKGDTVMAKGRAEATRDYILGGNPDIDQKRLPLSWFGTVENVEVGDNVFPLDESVNFITEIR